MTAKQQQDEALDVLIKDIQVFLELSFQNNELSLQEWIAKTINKIDSCCWIKKQCSETKCPAYQNECGRCWLIAGTQCGDKVLGKFADRYESCTNCEIYQEAVGDDRVRRLRELVYALVHSLRLRQDELKEAQSELKILNGLLPICMSCKRIRDDKGYWTQLESYIHNHSEAQFSHGICPECIEKIKPGILTRQNNYKNC